MLVVLVETRAVVPATIAGAAGSAVVVPYGFSVKGAGAVFTADAMFRAVEALAARAAELGKFFMKVTLQRTDLLAQRNDLCHQSLQFFGLDVGIGGENIKFHLLLHELFVKRGDGVMMFLDQLFALSLVFSPLFRKFDALFGKFGFHGVAFSFHFGLLFGGKLGLGVAFLNESRAVAVGVAMFTAYHALGAGGGLFGIRGLRNGRSDCEDCGGKKRKEEFLGIHCCILVRGDMPGEKGEELSSSL